MRCPRTCRSILTVAMQYAAYDMYARSYHDSAVNWASIEQEYPDVKIRTFCARDHRRDESRPTRPCWRKVRPATRCLPGDSRLRKRPT